MQGITENRHTSYLRLKLKSEEDLIRNLNGLYIKEGSAQLWILKQLCKSLRP